MNKMKVVSKAGTTQLILKSLKGQQINENEVYAINTDKVDGLLPLEVVQKGNSFKLIYNITGFISFKEYLMMPLNKERFAAILRNILANLKAMEGAYFNQQYLLMDFEHVIVNPATQRIYFVYVPIQFFESGTSLKGFLLDIIQYSSFVLGEDTSYVKEYIAILNRGVNFSVFDLEEYISTLFGNGVSPQQGIDHMQNHIPLHKETGSECASKEKTLSKIGATGKGVYDPFEEQKGKEAIREMIFQTGREQSVDNALDPYGGTMILGSITACGSDEPCQRHHPYLVREKTGEKIFVNRPLFRIGKEKKHSNYSILDNNAISRNHAEIITREMGYYIVDLNSTNKTFVNEKVIPAGKEVEILSETKIRLANEEFVFYIE